MNRPPEISARAVIGRRPTTLHTLANQTQPISPAEKRSDAESAEYIKGFFASIAGARGDNLDDSAGCLT